ncbi:MAG: tRNA (N(6)-L-threonylcarbamoyladenosine(37)-C(2))-methylthiotransferase MtaB [Anaerolineae bacterium]
MSERRQPRCVASAGDAPDEQTTGTLRVVKLYFTTLGCRLNEAEVEALARAAHAAGHQVVLDPATADWAIVNTCAVTHVAARKSRQAIRRLHAKACKARLAVVGCYGTLSSDEAAALPGVALVIANVDKERALQLILAASGGAADPALATATEPCPRRTRAFVKVQDGCDNRCTYCVVHIARGHSRSKPFSDVFLEAQARIEEGAQEIVLSGVNIGAYGRDLPQTGEEEGGLSLARLVGRLLAETSVPRIRLSSLEPWDVDESLLGLWSNPRLCRQLHLPLQSGSDTVLRRMGRPMVVADFCALAARVRSRVPDMSLSTDLIAGFPGESDYDFEETCRLVEELQFSRLHVFRFSPREGTPAARMAGRVADDVVRLRAQRLIALGAEGAERYHRRFVGQRVQVLFESPSSRGGVEGWGGLTDNYLRVWAPATGSLRNQIHEVRCTGADAAGLDGVIQEAT